MPITPVTAELDRLGIPYRTFTHPGPIASLAQAAAERGQRPEQVVRSILFRLDQTHFALVLVAGPAQVAWKTLRKHLGQSRLTTASEEEVLAVTGYQTGAVSPLGLPQPLPVYIDEGVTAEEEISLGSGVRGTTVILATADLLRALPQAEIGRFRTSTPAHE
jgi:Cys-tRNA(Pro)/Cys-tRNA(Cys) deacylase